MTPAEQSSWVVVGRAAGGDPDARGEFARRYGPFLRRVLHRRWAGTAYRGYFDDAVQDVFVQCYKPGGVIDRADPDRGASVRTVLYAVARNVAGRFERTHRPSLPWPDDATAPADDPNELDELTRDEARRLVRESLRRLRESADPTLRGYGELLHARAFDGRTIADLAAGDPAAAARLHLDYRKARRAFEAELAAAAAVEYPVPAAELRPLLVELLSALG